MSPGRTAVILLVGATGDLGGAVTRLLLAQRRAVRALVRPRSPEGPLRQAGAEVVLGDLKDRPALEAACQGAETLITTANSARRGGEDTPQTVDLEGNRQLIEAAQAAGRARQTYLGAQYGRLVARRGKKRGAVAVGHTILVIAYHLPRDGTEYHDLGPRYFDERDRQAVERRLVGRLQDLGYKVSLEPAA